MNALRITIAVFLTLVVIIASRYFGPNRSYRVTTSGQGITLSHKAARSHIDEGPAVIRLEAEFEGVKESDVRIELVGKVKGTESWERIPHGAIDSESEGAGRVFLFEIPHKVPTTRYFYRFEAAMAGKSPLILAQKNGEPMMVKFKTSVPVWLITVHVLAMFGGFFFLIWSGLHALKPAAGKGDTKIAARLGWWAWITLFIGGVPLGIPMNYYAFGTTWEAFPFGGDVTDNKTQVALIVWGIAAIGLSRGKGRKSALLAVFAAIIVLAIFLIPHSAQV